MDAKKFKNPDSILRPAPFWAINDRITPEETARQLRDMRDVGLSGGFFHSRAGLITDYLGDDWFQAMDAAIDAAKETDGYVWLYDEDLWPSGNAGGQVAGMKDEYRMAFLDATLIAPGEPLPEIGVDDEIKAVYAIKKRSGISLESIEMVPLEHLERGLGNERLVLKRHYAGKTGWWGGESYANLMNPEAMQQFIELTHDVYAKRLGSEFGKRVPGIFTDEPQVGMGDNYIPWYEGIPEIYAKWHKRDFWKDVPYLFFDGPEARKIRLLFHRTVLRQFTESFSKPIFEWCDKHGIEHTGHYNAEDSLRYQILNHCGGIMAHYRYQHAPGIDHLCRQIDGMLLTVKQVGSAARQLGRSRVLTEIFGVSRHTNTFEDFKWLGDYDLVLGANFFVPHLTWYSARGRRKRDYPPVWNYQQTYWHDLKPLNDYFTRVAYALTRGKAASNVLILHPIESATAAHRFGCDVPAAKWSEDAPARMEPVEVPKHDMTLADTLDKLFRRALDGALNAGYDCDLGDEGYVEDLGSVEGAKLRIGEMAYDVVVVPPSVTWRPSTYAKLKEFSKNGGRIIFMGELPKEIDCEPALENWTELASAQNSRAIPAAASALQSALDALAPKSFKLRDPNGEPVGATYVHHRQDGDEDIFFIVNSDRSHSSDYVLTLLDPRGRQVRVWNPLDGTTSRAQVTSAGDAAEYHFTLPPAGSLLLTVGGAALDEVPAPKTPDIAGGKVIELPSEWEFERLDPNVIVMDRVDVSLDGMKTWWGEDLDHRIRRRIAEHFGTRNALEWQPWVAVRKGLFDGKGGEITLRYRFTSDVESPKSVFLVMEDLTKGSMKVNGQDVDLSGADWHWDRGFGKVDITPLVQRGENIVDYTVNYDFLTEVEPAYLVGDFGAALDGLRAGKIVNEPSKLDTGSWVKQGYPFYSGRMVYRTSFDGKAGSETVLRLRQPSGILFKVRLNGQEAGSILWRPFLLDLTALVLDGKNQLEIEVVSSLQNSWGPLHEKEGDDNMWCGPDAFEWDVLLREEFSLFDYGLLGGAEIVVK